MISVMLYMFEITGVALCAGPAHDIIETREC